MVTFLFGALAMGFATTALFFLRFWATSRDRMFLFLAVAFALMSAERIADVTAFALPSPPLSLYGLRLLAFLAILIGLADKNRTGSSR